MSCHYVDIVEVYEIHKAVIVRAGTKAGIRDFSLLHSAVERPRVTYMGLDLYPTIFTKAAALLHSLCLNHPFTDGNKRTAWISTKRFLWLNGWNLTAERIEAADFMVWVDNIQPELTEISSWLKKQSKIVN